MALDRAKKNVLFLSACQALTMGATGMMMLVSPLVGAYLLEVDKEFATLPIAAMVTGTMVATVPASLWMRRVGRRYGFMTGTAIGFLAGAITSVAILTLDFRLFCIGTFLHGMYNAFGQYYRFAAADVASEDFRSRAISYVLAGGVVASVLGPEIGKQTQDLIDAHVYLGCYLSLMGLSLIVAMLLSRLDIPNLSKEERRTSGRPLGVIMRRPVFIVAALSGMMGYATMSLVMTATPLAMVAHNHSFASTAMVIQAHGLGMFAPAFITGSLIRRYGVLNIIQVGAMLLIACVFFNLIGIAFINFTVSLVLLGIGWNFMFIGGTALLTEAYEPIERAKTQAANDLLVFGSAALASLSSGVLLHLVGWQAVNYGVLPFIMLAILATLWLALRRRAAARVAETATPG